MCGGMPYIEDLVSANKSVVAVSSHHMPFSPAYRAPSLQFWHLFMLREPLSRALSIYEFERRQPSAASEGAKMSKLLRPKDFFRWYLEDSGSPSVIRNHYVRQLTDDWEHGKVLGEDDLRLAVRNSESHGVLIGLVERFDESMTMFELALRPHFPEIDLSYVTQNRSRLKEINAREHLRKRLGPTLVDLLMNNSALDIDFYHSVANRMDTQIGAIPDFAKHLKAFKRRRAQLQLKHAVASLLYPVYEQPIIKRFRSSR